MNRLSNYMLKSEKSRSQSLTTHEDLSISAGIPRQYKPDQTIVREVSQSRLEWDSRYLDQTGIAIDLRKSDDHPYGADRNAYTAAKSHRAR